MAMCGKIAAGIVTYNPEIARLRENLMSVYGQVEKVLLVDNASENIDDIRKLLNEFPGCELVRNGKNKGIAEALNQLMGLASEEEYDWVLTLDDDSVCDRDLVKKLSYYTDRKHVGIICPRAVDDKMDKVSKQFDDEYENVDSCITAGSLTSVKVWRSVGGFDRRMFIDFVDIEYCRRLKIKGYGILRVNGTCIHQQYGNISGSFSFFGKKFYIFNYSPARIYHSVRNQIYYIKKHRKYISVWRQLLYLTGYIGKRIIFEKNRRMSCKAVCRGIKDGIKMRV